MMELDLFKLEKLEVQAFADVKRSGEPVATFVAMFNPESFKKSYGIRWHDQQGAATTGAEPVYSRSEPARLELTLVEDGTGVDVLGIEASGRPTVEERIKEFLDIAYKLDGDLHRPRFLKIVWGILDFDCLLRDLEIQYDLFDRDGQPLRAELRTSFVSEIEDDRRAQLENKKSADLSHRRTVRAGDTLPLLTRRIYGTAGPYLAVARFNQLDDFRHLKPGRTLVFPPREQLADGRGGEP